MATLRYIIYYKKIFEIRRKKENKSDTTAKDFKKHIGLKSQANSHKNARVANCD